MKLNILTGINSPTLYFPNLLMGMLYLTVESGFSMGIFEQNSGLNTGIPIFHWVYLCLFPGIRAKFEPVGWRLCRQPTGSNSYSWGREKRCSVCIESYLSSSQYGWRTEQTNLRFLLSRLKSEIKIFHNNVN